MLSSWIKFVAVVADIDRAQIERLVAVGPVGLGDHRVLLAVHDEIAVALAAEIELQGFGDIADRDAQGAGAIAVDFDRHLRLVEFQVQIDHLEDGAGLGLLHETAG